MRTPMVFLGVLWALACSDVIPEPEPCSTDADCPAGRCLFGSCQPRTADGDQGPRPDGLPGVDAQDQGRPTDMALMDRAVLDSAPPADASPAQDLALAPDGSRGPDMASPDAAPPVDMEPAPPVDMEPAPDAAPLVDMEPAPDAAPADMAPAPDMAPADCGGYREACCPGERCDEGACVGGRCATFGGVYGLRDIDEPGRECQGNPLNAGACGCPQGFQDLRLEDADWETDEGSGFTNQVHVCLSADRVPQADLQGVYSAQVEDPANNCENRCTDNPVLDLCACPAGTADRSVLGVHYQRGANDCVKTASFCEGIGVPHFTWGGVYQLITDERRGSCRDIAQAQRCVPNAITGACTCPPGFRAVAYDWMAKNPTIEEPLWFCGGTLNVCMRAPGAE